MLRIVLIENLGGQKPPENLCRVGTGQINPDLPRESPADFDHQLFDDTFTYT